MSNLAIAFLAVLVVAAAVAAPAGVAPDLRYLNAYLTDDCTGTSYNFSHSVPDLNVYGLANAIKCKCATGAWVMYEDIDYDCRRSSFVGFDGCFPVSYEVSSFRYAGSPIGLNDVYYNLYTDINFEGREFRSNADVETLEEVDQDVSSLIIMGQSAWTFYTGQRYSGASVCVYPDSSLTSLDGSAMMQHNGFDFMSSLDLPDNSIRSVARGCFSDTVVRGVPVTNPLGLDESRTVFNTKN